MSYNFSKGYQIIGDLSGSDDANRDTGIDFEENEIKLVAGGSTRFKISGSNGEITFNEAYKFPTADGNADQILQTNGSGQLSFVDVDGGEGGGGGSSTPQVLKAGLNYTFNLTGSAVSQIVPLENVIFDTFTTGGWDAVNHRFVAGEEGYYDMAATLVLGEVDDNPSQYQLWLLSDSDHATSSSVGHYVALTNFSPRPSDMDIHTMHVNTIVHLSASQSASLMVRLAGTNDGETSHVKGPRNRTFICVKKL